MKIVVTTPQSGTTDGNNLELFLQDTGWDFIPRQRKSLKHLKEQTQADGVVVWNQTGPILNVGEEKLFFHPSMAKNRLVAFRRKGSIDPMVRAFALSPGDSVLDCTLGLGADAVVSSYFSGAGKVVGLESIESVAAVIRWGMKLYINPLRWLQDTVRRITVVTADHNDYLKTLPDKSYDIVYFDPMFRHPLTQSQAISPLRLLADSRPLNGEAIEQACRVARKRVVVKEQMRAGEFQRLHLIPDDSRNNGRFGYGIIITEDKSQYLNTR